MRPNSSFSNSGYRGARNCIFFCKHDTWLLRFKYLYDSALVQKSHRMSNATFKIIWALSARMIVAVKDWRSAMAAFAHSVMNIIFLRAQKQMIWIGTSRIVAFMQYEKSLWYDAFKLFKRKSIRAYPSIPVYDNKPVLVTNSGSCPIPAACLFYYMIFIIAVDGAKQCS
jgi:hypothetical protein